MPIIETERYEITPHPIGQGGFGEVYLARDLLYERDVVIKTIKSSGLFGLDDPTIRRKFFRGFKTLDGAGGITLLQECAAELELGHFIIRLGLNYFAQQGCRLVCMALHQKRVAKMIAGHRILGVYLQFGAKFLSGGFEITLTKVNKAHQKVRLGKPRIEL